MEKLANDVAVKVMQKLALGRPDGNILYKMHQAIAAPTSKYNPFKWMGELMSPDALRANRLAFENDTTSIPRGLGAGLLMHPLAAIGGLVGTGIGAAYSGFQPTEAELLSAVLPYAGAGGLIGEVAGSAIGSHINDKVVFPGGASRGMLDKHFGSTRGNLSDSIYRMLTGTQAEMPIAIRESL